MTRTPMPETSVHLHHQLYFRKRKIRPPKNTMMPPPARDFVFAKNLYQREFRVLVPAPANPRHHFRPLRLGENVRHSSGIKAHFESGQIPLATGRYVLNCNAIEVPRQIELVQQACQSPRAAANLGTVATLKCSGCGIEVEPSGNFGHSAIRYQFLQKRVARRCHQASTVIA